MLMFPAPFLVLSIVLCLEGTNATVSYVELQVHQEIRAGFLLQEDTRDPAYVVLVSGGAIERIEKKLVQQEVQRAEVAVTKVPSADLVRGLSHAEVSIRGRCQRLLIDQGDLAVPALPAGLSAELPDALRRTLEVIIRTPDPQLATPVRRVLRHPDEAVRARAVDAYFIMRPEDALDMAPSMLGRENSDWVKHRLLLSLGGCGSLNAVPAILASYDEDMPPPLAQAAQSALRRLTGQNYSKRRHWLAWWDLQQKEKQGPDSE